MLYNNSLIVIFLLSLAFPEIFKFISFISADVSSKLSVAAHKVPFFPKMAAPHKAFLMSSLFLFAFSVKGSKFIKRL